MLASARHLLQTKLTVPPARAELVSRPRLIEQFNRGLSRPLTLICAPAGFGKTTLLSEWLDSETGSDMPLAWVSLDEDDNDPGRFLTYIICALTNVGSFLDGEDLLSLLQSSQPPPPKAILTSLISQMEAYPNRLGLVLDDYHLISTPVIHEAMAFFLDHLPYQMRLVITSREDPPLPLARLRGRGQLAEIRADDLRFLKEEAALFLQEALGLTLTTQQVMDLDARTEGWIAGLQLAALAMKGREDLTGFISAFTGSHRFILDYLTEEVLSRQPEHIQSFLLQTSILNHMCGPLCNVVSGRSDSLVLLEQIERDNLFLIPLDDDRRWYRYHHLFGDMLQNRLRQLMPASEIKDLHYRASHWFANESLIDEAINHAMAAHELDFAAALMEKYSHQYLVASRDNFAIKRADELPDEVLRKYPHLALQVGMNHGFFGHTDQAQRYLSLARLSIDTSESPPDILKELKGHADTLEALVANRNNDLEGVFRAAENAMHHLAEHQRELRISVLIVLGITFDRQQQFTRSREVKQEALEIALTSNDTNMITTVMGQMAQSFLIEGRMYDCEAACLNLIETASTDNREYLQAVGIGYAFLALIYFEQNRFDEAMTASVRGIELCESTMPNGTLICQTVLARIYHLKGDRVAVQTAGQVIQDILRKHPLMSARINIPVLVHLWVLEDMQSLYREATPQLENFPDTISWQQTRRLEHLRANLASKETFKRIEAYALLDELHTLIPTPVPLLWYLEMLVLETLVLDLDGRRHEAFVTLQCALELAEPQGFARVFIDGGERFIQFLWTAKERGIGVPYTTQLLDSTVQKAVVSRQATRDAHSDIEPLSDRELEVLRLIADGASNREIAEALVVSVGTVKKHLNNIFLKLDAHNRTQAVATARNYNLL